MRSVPAFAILALVLALSACGGGGGHPGECLSGSAQTCQKSGESGAQDGN